MSLSNCTMQQLALHSLYLALNQIPIVSSFNSVPALLHVKVPISLHRKTYEVVGDVPTGQEKFAVVVVATADKPDGMGQITKRTRCGKST